MDNKKQSSISIAIVAMGGQGGGVLSDWIVALAERASYYAQSTSVPGVAQRTGSTVYYVELFPRSPDDVSNNRFPVMSLMPTPGDVDVVIAGELIEAGRSVIRGFSTKDKTTLIGSSHRDYALSEKMEMGDGRKDSNLILESCRQFSKHLIAYDMASVASGAGSVISSVMFGSLAASKALPFDRESFEQLIREGGFAVEANLRGFAAGYDNAKAILDVGAYPANIITTDKTQRYVFPTAKHPQSQSLLNRIQSEFPEPVHEVFVAAVRRLIDYQDIKYAERYLDQMARVFVADKASGGELHKYRFTLEAGRYLSLWMSYEDAVRVADLKTRKQRFARVEKEVRAEDGQIVQVREFMHPRVEEICDVLPAGIGRYVLNSSSMSRFLSVFCKARQVRTSTLSGFLLLYTLSGMGRWRRSSYRYQLENQRMESWLGKLIEVVAGDYQAAVELAECQRLVKGYGDTLERGVVNFNRIFDLLPDILNSDGAADTVKKLRTAALKDDTGSALDKAIQSALPA